ncbi:anaphase-promoting complex subunit Cut9 [Tilletia horrida]|nr:anaphase-promoting complex subunit Cut9 [Tilletia horrida]
MNRLDAAQAPNPFTPPQGHGALNGAPALEGPTRPTHNRVGPAAPAPPLMASFSPAATGTRIGPSAFMLGTGESSLSIIRDDPEASRSGLIGMSPLMFRQGLHNQQQQHQQSQLHAHGGATGATAAGTGASLGSPGPSRLGRASGSVLGLMHPMHPNILPASVASGSSLPGADAPAANGSFAEHHASGADGGHEGPGPSADMLQRMRIWRTDAMHHHLYDSAIFWGDKVLSLEETDLAWNDAYWLAQAYFMTHQYARAEHLLTRPLRSAYTRKLAEEQQNSAGLAVAGLSDLGEERADVNAKLGKTDFDRAQIPRAVDVIGTAISRARETAILPKVLLDKMPPKPFEKETRAPPVAEQALRDEPMLPRSKSAPQRGSLFVGSGLTKTTSTSALAAGKRKDRTFTVSGTGTGSSVGEQDGENGSVESGNSASGLGGEAEGIDLDAPFGSRGENGSAGHVLEEAKEWQQEDARNLRDIADRRLAAFDGPVLANISLACRCLAAQCQVRLAKYYDALDTLGGDTAPWNLKAQETFKEPAVDGGIKLGSTAHFLRGQIHMRLDDLVKARECFMHALAIDVKNYEAFCALVHGNLLSVAEQWSFVKALQYTAQAGEHPEDGEFIRLMYISKLPKQAPEHLSEASLARRSLMTQFKVEDNADVLWSLAEELFAQMRYADAFTITSRIMELSKDHEGALPIHVTCMFYMPKMRPALFMLAHRLVEDDPESPAAWYAVGAWYGSASRWAEARRYFSKATLLDPRFAPSWIAFGHSFANEGESDQAITAYATAARKFQFSHLPKLFIGMEHCHQGNYKLADVFLRGAVTTAPKDPLALNELGVLEYLNNRVERAIELFEQVLAISEKLQEPASAWVVAHMNLAFALRQAGRDEEAKMRFLRVIELEPINIAAHVGVGMCEHKSGNLSTAIAWYHDLAKRLRQLVLLPLIIIFGVRAAYALTLVDKPCAPGHSGTPRYGGQQQLRIFFPMYWAWYSSIKAIEWAFYPRPTLQRPLLDLSRRLDRLAETKDKKPTQPDADGNGHSSAHDAADLPTFLPGTKIPLELDLLCSLRGAGWDWGPRYSAHNPPPTPFALIAHDERAIAAWRAARIRYLKDQLGCLLTTLFLVDVLDGLNKSEVIWGVLAGEGAPIVDGMLLHEGMDFTTLSIPAQLFLSFNTGCFIVIAMGLLHSVPSLLFVLPSVIWPHNKFIANYLWSDPAHWMPAMVDLRWWAVGNLRRLWSRHWHQVLRRCFFVGAYYPTQAVLGWIIRLEDVASGKPVRDAANGDRAATSADGKSQTNGNGTVGSSARKRSSKIMMVNALCALSTFILSGVMHEFFILGAARNAAERSPLRVVGLGPPIEYADGSVDRGGGMLLFFVLQGLACIGEEVFEAVSGRKVGGVLGTVWVLGFITLSSYPFGKVWWYLGIANGPQINPLTRKLIDWTAMKLLAARG